MTEKLYQVGKIVNTHGLKGEIKVMASTDFPKERFAVGSKLFVMQAKGPVPVEVTHHRVNKQFDLLTLKGFDSLTAVESFKGSDLKVAETAQQDLDDGYYYREIIGLQVITTENKPLGTVKEILSPGPNDVWIVENEDGKQVLIPYLKSVVVKIDLDANMATIDLPEGLIDDED